MADVKLGQSKGPATAAKRTLSPEIRKAQLLAGARQVLATVGFSKMRVSDVVTAAGLSQGSFYLYFTGKDDIIIELIRLMIDEAQVALDAIGVERLDMDKGLRAIISEYYRVCLTYRDVVENVDGISLGIDSNRWNGAFVSLNDFVLRAIDGWRADGEIDAGARTDILSWLFIDTVNGALPRLFGRTAGRVSDDYVARIGDWMLGALRSARSEA